MKKISYIKLAFLSLTTVTMLSSCLKDDAHYTDFAGSKLLVELPIATGVGAAGGFISAVAYPISTTPVALSLLVNEAAPKPSSTALTVKVSVDVAALTAYNAATQKQYTADSTADVAAGNDPRVKPALYTLLPAAFYNSTFTTTIPANKNSANIVFNIVTANFDLTKSYVLPITITDAGGQQISNYKTVFYNVQAKNAYDGLYTTTGTFVRVGLDQRAINQVNPLATINGNTVQTSVADLGGSYPINLTINPDNSVTVTFVGGSLDNLPGDYTSVGVNKYDPATKTFTLHYQYRSGARTTEETLVYKGPRP